MVAEPTGSWLAGATEAPTIVMYGRSIRSARSVFVAGAGDGSESEQARWQEWIGSCSLMTVDRKSPSRQTRPIAPCPREL